MRTPIILCCFFLSISSYSQKIKDSTIYFESYKGKLNQPLTDFTKVPVPNNIKNAGLKMISFISNIPDSVRAVFEGKITSITEVGNAYLLITNFGRYSIAYYGLSKPAFKSGDSIMRNQFLSKLARNPFGQYYLTIQFYKDDMEVDPKDWIK